MIVRALDSLHDWQYGKGKNDYKRNRSAVAQNIDTRLLSFLGDCFFKIDAGIDWFNLLGAKSEVAILLSINTTILSTAYVTGLQQTSLSLNENTRRLTVTYRVDTSFGELTSSTVLGLTNLG